MNFAIVDDGIIIEFQGGDTYLYNSLSAGAENIEKMKALALKGKGLSTFISKYVHDKFAEKIR